MSISVCSCAVGKSSPWWSDVLCQVLPWSINFPRITGPLAGSITISGSPRFTIVFMLPGLEHEIPNRRHRGATRLGNEAFLLRVQRIKISALEDFSPLAWKVCQKLPKRHIKKCGTRKTHKNTSNYQWENMGKSSVGHVFVWFDLKFGRVYGRYLQFRFMKWPPDHR